MSIYLADKDHPAYGYVRAFVKDSNDVTSELSFLDSDGQVNSNEPRAGLPEHGGEHACAVPGARHARPGLSCAGRGARAAPLNPAAPAAKPLLCLAHADVNDGAWHMITLSTFANGTEGYRLYVDGRPVLQPRL